MSAYVGFLIVRSIEEVLSGIDRISRPPNRHVTRTVTGDLHASVDHTHEVIGWKHSPIILGQHCQVWWHDFEAGT